MAIDNNSVVVLWFAWKLLSLRYKKQLVSSGISPCVCCDLLENYYLCAIRNNSFFLGLINRPLWFAWKLLSLRYKKQQLDNSHLRKASCDLLENYYLCAIRNNSCSTQLAMLMLWFAWKLLSLRYKKQRYHRSHWWSSGCDLLENYYLCAIRNNRW